MTPTHLKITTNSSENNHQLVWNTKLNHLAWTAYLSKTYNPPPPYAVPARQSDYRNLPPAYTFVCDAEPFYCEALEYINNLKSAGVEAKIDIYKDHFHAFDLFLPFSETTKRAVAEFEKQYLYATEHYFAKQKD